MDLNQGMTRIYIHGIFGLIQPRVTSVVSFLAPKPGLSPRHPIEASFENNSTANMSLDST